MYLFSRISQLIVRSFAQCLPMSHIASHRSGQSTCTSCLCLQIHSLSVIPQPPRHWQVSDLTHKDTDMDTAHKRPQRGNDAQYYLQLHKASPPTLRPTQDRKYLGGVPRVQTRRRAQAPGERSSSFTKCSLFTVTAGKLSLL